MRIYFDSSVILRVVLGEADRLREWTHRAEAVTSEITRVECLRCLDRMRLSGAAENPLAARRGALLKILGAIETVRLNRPVLERAAAPFSVLIRTLDALHLASALIARPRFPALRFASHDTSLLAAATAEGLSVLGP